MNDDRKSPTAAPRHVELEHAISWWLDRSRVVGHAMDYVQALRRELRTLVETDDAR